MKSDEIPTFWMVIESTPHPHPGPLAGPPKKSTPAAPSDCFSSVKRISNNASRASRATSSGLGCNDVKNVCIASNEPTTFGHTGDVYNFHADRWGYMGIYWFTGVFI